MEGTRQDILAEIENWAANENAPNILWMKGHPGVGKSAISTSLVENLRLSGRLGSSFFFRRERASVMTPHALWRTVAYDLACRYPTIRQYLVSSLSRDGSILATSNVDELFRHLIHEPLMASEAMPIGSAPIIVVDALDECGGLSGKQSIHRSNLVRTLRHVSRLPRVFKFVVTSRSENDFETLFSTINCHLVEISAGQTANRESSEDIQRFLEHHFGQVTARYPNSLPPYWPGHEIINVLTKKAAGLFIWAKII